MDRGGLEGLIHAHQAELYRYVRYLGATEANAEDVVQDTFLAAMETKTSIESLDEHARGAWLRGVARNVFYMRCRRETKNPVRVTSDSLAKAELVWSEEFLRGRDGFDYVEALRKCVEKLPSKHREVLDLRYRQRKSRPAIAEAFGMKSDGVKSMLRRIRASLAECVEQSMEGSAG